MRCQRPCRRSRHSHRCMGTQVVVLLACSALLSAHAAAVSDQQAGGRKLKQLTVFYETPTAAGSTSVGVNGRTAIRPDGTFHAAAATSYSSTDAFSNPFLYWLTDGAYNNRPEAASTTYEQIPLALQSTQYPTLSYGLAEGRGDALSTSDAGWGTLEFGYNPLSNNLGTSVSTGATNSLNVGANERIGDADPQSGVAGVEFAGYSNDLTNLADARTDQSGQAIAFPHNLISPLNPLTCTQTLLYGLTLSNYDLGAPVTPVPREDPGSTLIPYCLQFFNFGTLDHFAAFVDEDTDYELNFDNNGDGRVDGLRGSDSVPGGRLFNRPGSSAASPAGTTTTTTTITAPPVEPTSSNTREQKQGSSSTSQKSASKSAAATPRSNADNPSNKGAGPSAASRPVPHDVRASAILPQSKSQSSKTPKNFSELVDMRVQNGPAELKAFAQTRMGSQLIDRFKTSPVAKVSDDTVTLLANAAARSADGLADTVKNVTAAAGNFTRGLVLNGTNLAMKSAVAALETAEPLFKITKMANDALTQVADASNKVAADLAKKSSKYLQEQIAQLPEGKLKEQAKTTATGIKTGGTRSSNTGQKAQMGRRRLLHWPW